MRRQTSAPSERAGDEAGVGWPKWRVRVVVAREGREAVLEDAFGVGWPVRVYELAGRDVSFEPCLYSCHSLSERSARWREVLPLRHVRVRPHGRRFS